MKQQLIFTYNAQSGMASALVDYGRKYIAPNKYDCELCMVSYGPFGMKNDWKKFIKTLDADVRFLHKDEFTKEFPAVELTHPSLYSATSQKVLMSGADFKGIETLEQLKEKVIKVL